MQELALIVVGAAVCLGSAVVAIRSYLRHRAWVEKADVFVAYANRMGLTTSAERGRLLGSKRVVVEGALDGQQVRIEEIQRENQLIPDVPDSDRIRSGWRIRVRPPGGIPWNLQLCREGRSYGVRKKFTGHDIQIGDDEFDRAFLITSPNPAGVIGLLGSNTRSFIRHAVGTHDWIIDGSCIRCELRALPGDADELDRLVQDAIGLSMSLVPRGTVEEMLIDNLFSERLVGVRLRNLEMLARLPRTPEIERALERAAGDSAWAVSVAAAEYLGERGLGSLMAATTNAPGHLAVQAVHALSQYDGEAVRETVRVALEHPREDVVSAAIEVVGKWRDEKSMAALGLILAGQRSPGLRAAAAEAIGRLRLDEARPVLVRALDRPDVDVRLAVVKALGRVGQADDVMQLLEIADKGETRALRMAARQSVAAIQLNLGQVERGWTSMVERRPEDGALSIDEAAPPGALSVEGAEEPPETKRGPAGEPRRRERER